MSSSVRPIKIAILAMGGQGGGVLSDWIVAAAESQDYLAQTTSVPGVAQRTGATIYYVELFPEAEAVRRGRDPVLALMPVPGDVDVVIAAELMEAGRAVNRGLVTPERTTLIASTHRDYAIAEKMAMGNGLADPAQVLAAGEQAAKRLISFDMEAMADAQRSVISAVLLGALAASEALPLPRSGFEDAIRRGGIGVDASLRAFAAAIERVQGAASPPPEPPESAPAAHHPAVAALLLRVRGFPAGAMINVTAGVRRLIDYQDPAYAEAYLDRLQAVLALDERHGGAARKHELTAETARYLALWMSYEDTIRVADLKTRASRFERFATEVEARPDQVVYVTEFMHPRFEEICDTLPAALGRRMMASAAARRLIGRFTRHGRRVRTATASAFTLLFVLARLRRWRRSTLRYQTEQVRIEDWLERVKLLADEDYDLALEVVRCQRLVKGYGDTFARGLQSFETILAQVEGLRVREEAAGTVRRLREAALADEEGDGLRKALAELAVAGPVADSPPVVST